MIFQKKSLDKLLFAYYNIVVTEKVTRNKELGH